MTTGDMSVNVSLPSSGSRNEWFLIARLMVFLPNQSDGHWTEYSSAKMNDSSSLATRIKVGSDTERGIRQEQDSYRTRNQDFAAPAPFHMPIEVVSVRVREHPHEERTPTGVVSWTERIERESEWRNSMEADGRPKGAVEPSGTLQLNMRDRDEEMSRQKRGSCAWNFASTISYAQREITPATTSNRRNKNSQRNFSQHCWSTKTHKFFRRSVVAPISLPTCNWLKRTWCLSTSASLTNTSSHGHLVFKPCLHGANWPRTPADLFACVKVHLATCLPISTTTQTILDGFKRAVSHSTSANLAHIFSHTL